MDPLRTALADLVRENASRARVEGDEDFEAPFRDVGIDSLEAMSIMLAAMERFEVKIADAELDGIGSLAQLESCIRKHLG